jgi:hypothetical protein
MALEEKDSQRKAVLQELELHLKSMTEGAKLQDNQQERVSRERIEGAKLSQKRMELAQSALVHPMAAPVAQTWPGLPPGQGPPGGMPGGRII